jgi:hypothetical protein
MGGRGARLWRCRDADELVPLLGDRHHIGVAGEQLGKRVGDLAVVDASESLIGQILEARHEVDAK